MTTNPAYNTVDVLWRFMRDSCHIKHNIVSSCSYTHSMYLALLAGGMMLKKVIKKTLGLSGKEGLAVFDMDVTGKTDLRKEFKARINNLELSRDKKEKIIEEKQRCFKMNNSLANNVKPNMHSYSRIMKLLLVCLFLVTSFLVIVAYSLYQVMSK